MFKRFFCVICPSILAFARNRAGGTMVVFGLAFIPAALMAGVAVDFGRVTILKSSLQAAADAAVLAAGAQQGMTKAGRASIAETVVLANLGPKAKGANIVVKETEPGQGVYQVAVDAALPTTIMRIAHFDTLPVRVTSEARNIGGAGHPIEIALALDNTGSMRNDMPALKSAAKNLVQALMTDANSQVRVSVVPYVAAVNPGLSESAILDTSAQTPLAGAWFNGGWLAHDAGCTPVWGGGGGGSGPGGSNSGDVSGDARDLIDLISPFRRIASELFGVSAAFAADITPNTIPTLVLQDNTSPVTGRTFKAPVGFKIYPKDAYTGGCDWLTNPDRINPYELFARLKGSSGSGTVAWKGCVEARATTQEIALANSWGQSFASVVDYDVTDAPPTNGDPASLFAPYFWPDEPDYSTTTWGPIAPGAYVAGSGGFHNNYLKDFAFPATWGWKRDDWGNGRDILKYDRTTASAIIRETAPETYGPNAACPEPVTRLTNNQSQVIHAIDQMNYWYNGGTIISEGFTWAWRTLSPQKPYADGKPYSEEARKVIVLMTDGVNGLADNGNSNSPHISDYSAYGYLGAPRLTWGDSVTTYAGLQTFLDNRLKKACDNAKAKGIKIYTVMFNHNGFLSGAEQAHSAALLQYCASQPEYAYLATDSNALQGAFGQIAASAGATPLRLTR